MGYRAMEFPHMPRWFAAFADGFGSITSSGILSVHMNQEATLCGMAESRFHGTRPREGRVVEAIGAEVMEIVDGKIKEIRDYHRPVPAKAA